MQAKRILFYLEPVTYADSPFRLQGWLNFFNLFAKQSTAAFTSQIAASPLICSLETTAFSEKYQLDQIQLLKASNFNRASYSRDLCFGFGYFNRPLLDALREIKKSFFPEIVISVSENRYLKKVFGAQNVMFMELGPLPRNGVRPSVHVDPYGHQVSSALDWFSRSTWSHSSLRRFGDIWRERWLEPVRRIGESSGVAAWLNEARGGKKLMLAALQPSDWITYEGIGPTLDPVSLLRKISSEIDDDWLIVPQWHGSNVAPTNEMFDEIIRSQNNIVYLPPEFRMANSEVIFPEVDGVVTISSNVAALGIVDGKRVDVVGNSKFRKVSSVSKNPRIDILAFLSSKYCRPLDDFLHIEGAFADHIDRIHQNPKWLFDPSDIDSTHLEAFFPASPGTS